EVSECERITFVGVIVVIRGVDVIAFHLESMAVSLAHSKSCAAIKRFGGTLGVRHASQNDSERTWTGVVDGISVCRQAGWPCRSICVNKARQIHALVPGEIEVGCPTGSNLLLESCIDSIDPGI